MSVPCIVVDHHLLSLKSDNYSFTYTGNSTLWLNQGQKQGAIILHIFSTHSSCTNMYFRRVLNIQETAYVKCDIS